MKDRKKIAIVTGGSSGIGRCTAAALCRRGCRVYEFSRREMITDGIVHITADITDEKQVRTAVGRVLKREGRIDILVNNAGCVISGACETTDSSMSHAQMETNLFGMDNVTRAVLPVMRKQRRGRIVCVSSVAAVMPIPFQTWYSVSKAAVNAYALALQNEVRPWHISVCAVLPGDIASGITDVRTKLKDSSGAYSERMTRSVGRMEHDERNGMKAETAGEKIAEIAMRRRSKPLIAIGGTYELAVIAAKLLPRRMSNWIVGLIYAK